MAVENPPAGYAGATPYLIVTDAEAAIAWYEKVLGATCIYRMVMGGKIGHAELQISGGHFMLASEFPEMGHLSAETRGGSPVSMLVYVADVDAAYAAATAHGAKADLAPELKPWGDRAVLVTDPFGHRWTLATHVEDVSFEELDRRMAAFGSAA